MSAALEVSSLDRLLASLDRQGRGFELLCRWFLQNDPEFRAEYKEVWLWRDWPGRWGPDRGIDLVAVTFAGGTDAIQAKHYGLEHTVTKRDIDTFLSESNRRGIESRLLIASTDRLARSAREVMAEQEKPVSTCLLARIRASAIEWPASIAELAPATPAAAEPREHQLQALEEIERWAAAGGVRGQVIMACGTGKSLVEVWAAERLGAGQVLVLVPTIPLVRQCAREWPRHAATQRGLLRICSDKAAPDAEDIIRGDELGTARTTDATEIAERLRDGSPLLAICTYDSSPVLAEAMRAVPGFSFDLAIADEAHRCAGLEGSRHKTILDENAIGARRRLFFTATPTIYGTRDKSRAANKNVRLASMDDHALFGRVVHHLSFADAIAKGLLCPYQVAVIPIDDEEVHELIKRRRIVTADGEHKLEAAGLATQIACARAMRRFGCRRIVAFHPSIAESKRFSEHFPIAVELLAEDEHPAGPVWSEHVDGAGMPYATRTRLLEHFESDGAEYRLLSNVRLLTEGVDVPGIDAIAFVDTRRGHGAIIQAVGRAVRPAPGKETGTIVLPVVLRKGESFDVALARSEHRSIVDILGALRSHDADIIRSLDSLRFTAGPDDPRPAGHGRFVIDAPLEVGEDFAAAVDIALTGALGVTSERAPRRRDSTRIEALLPPLESKPLTDDELLEVGIGRLASLGRWQLQTEVPGEDEDSFPMQACWREVKKRWAAGTLGEYDREAIADSISWLASDLQHHPAQQREMARLTDADVPEQMAAQCRGGGVYAEQLEALTGWEDADELIEPFAAIQPLITHAAMSPTMRVRYMLPAARRLAAAVRDAGEASGLGWWERQSWYTAAINGFMYELQLAHAGPSALDTPTEPWTANVVPAAHIIGRRAAEAFAPLARRMWIYSFSGDREAVEGRLQDEAQMPADERLDALGWDIYLLARARGDSNEDALELAMQDTLHVREKVRRDLVVRSVRQLES